MAVRLIDWAVDETTAVQPGTEPVTALVPARTLLEIGKTFGHSGSISVAITSTDDRELIAFRADKKTVTSLQPGGTVVACHWRRPIDGCEFNGDEVHQRLLQGMLKRVALTPVCHLMEPDMRLDVWSGDARSVAQREGFA